MVAGTVRGQRECADIIAAALDQGWVHKVTGATGKKGTTRSNNHIYLVPPNGGPPVGIAGTPSDIHQRRQVIRAMKRGGLIWPPPPKKKPRKEDEVVMLTEVIAAAQDQGWQVNQEKKSVVFCPPDPKKPRMTVPANGSGVNFFDLRNLKRAGLIWPWTPPIRTSSGGNVTPVQELVAEAWKQLVEYPSYEISNAARCRERETGKLVVPDPSGEVTLTKGGKTQYKHVRGLVIAHFGHPPLKNVILSDEAMGHRTGESKAILDSINNQEDQEVSLPLKTPDELPELEDGWAYIKSVPEAIDGYAVSVEGELRGPDGKKRSPSKIGHQLWAYLRRFDHPKNNRAVRLDRLVLAAHEGPALNAKDQPIHKDGDSFNCALSNLAWPAAGQNVTRISAVPDIEDEATEPTHVDVSVDEAVEAVQEGRLESQAAAIEDTAERYEHQDYVDRVVGEAPSFSDPGKTVAEVQAERAAEFAEAEAERAEEQKKPRRRKSRAKSPSQRAAAHRAKAVKEASPAPLRGVLSGRYWHDEQTGLVMFVGDDGTVEFPKVEGPEDSKALLKLAALAQEWISVMGIG